METPPIEGGNEEASETTETPQTGEALGEAGVPAERLEQGGPGPQEAAEQAEPAPVETGEGEIPSRERARPDERDRPYGRPREREGGRGPREGGRRDRRFRRARRKVCSFCVDKVEGIDYKDYNRLREFVSDRGKILKSRMTGACGRHQRALARAIKRARQVALIPFVSD